MNQAVITADIIHSSKLNAENKALLYKSIKDVLGRTDEDFDSKSEMFRGDSFQCLIPKPKDTLRIALIIKTYIRSLNVSELHKVKSTSFPEKKRSIIYPLWMFDVRMAVGIGSVVTPIKGLGTADGLAFEMSGRMLDELKDSRQKFAITSMDRFKSELKMESALLDAIISRTTALQCEVIYYKLLHYTETQISKKLQIEQAAVNQRSVSGSWNVISKMVDYFENLYENG